MSTTSNLKLNKHDNVSTNTNPFDIENYLNVNWDKIDKYAGNSNSTILKLQEENTRLKETIKTELEEKTIEAESIEVNDSAETNCEIDLQGNTTQEASPNPDYPSKVETVTGSVEVKVSNKNRLENKAISGTQNGITYTINDDKSVTLNGTSTAITWIILNSEITLPRGTYTMSSGKESNSARLYCGAIGNFTDKGIRTVTLTEEKTSDVSINIVSGVTLENFTIYPMIEKGTTATDYVQHKEQTYTLYLPFELCKIGEYKDYIFKENNKWYKHKEIGKIVFDGTRTGWGFGTAGLENMNVANINIPSMLIQNFGLGFCNYFIRGTSKEINTLRFGANDSQLWFYVNATEFTNINDWKTWLSNNNITVYYVLTTPIDEEITDTTLIQQLNKLEEAMSYYGTTYADTTNEVIKPILKFTYNRSNRLRIENLEKAIINS